MALSPRANLFDGGSPPPPGASLDGVVDRVTFHNEENGWSVVQLQIDGELELATAVGVLPGIRKGELVRLEGEWVVDRKFGRQFKATSYLPRSPSTVNGIRKYLGSGMVPGIGKEMARRLVDRFGVDTLKVIDETPWRLTDVSGIGRKRQEQIVSAWKEQRAVRDVMVFLQSHGVTPGYAMKIYRRYGDKAIQKVRRNPYRLAQDIVGIGFGTADKIASELGIAADSPQRAEAGTLHTLREARDSGHVFLPAEELVRAAEQMLEVDSILVEAALLRLEERGDIVREGGTELDSDPVYLSALYAAETEVASQLARIVGAAPKEIDLDVEAALSWVQRVTGVELAENQANAVRRAVEQPVLVVTGGPGTGKTTLVNSILRIFKSKGHSIALCAPTGRAAKRMHETTGHGASTIHRMLEFSPKTGTFTRDQDAPIEADLIVVDEVSMVDINLVYSLLAAVPTGARLILVGDIDQLPSVGPGSVLRDIIDSRCVSVVSLTEIFRQEKTSAIVVNAHRVNEGLGPVESEEESDFYFLARNEPEDVLSTIVELVSRRIPGRFGLDPFSDIQVLTPMHRGLLGASNLNDVLQATLNPNGARLVRGGREYRVGDKVMQIRNNYDLDVFNGDLGRVVDVDDEDATVRVLFDKEVEYEAAGLDELMRAYACSIHKSQGSEYPCVVVPVHTQHYVMLQRNLLYTAITRGRRLVVLVGSRQALQMCIRNDRVARRYTRLASRLVPLVQ